MTAVGLCACGCGRVTKSYPSTNARLGHVKGQPRQWVKGHHVRKPLQYVVDANGCWVWQLATRHGYGAMKVDGRMFGAHVIFYQRHVGPIPPGMELDHLCRNRACVNPAHLEPVTHAENMRRSPRTTRLTAEQADRIRASGESNKTLAVRYGVDPSLISHIRRGAKWVAA